MTALGVSSAPVQAVTTRRLSIGPGLISLGAAVVILAIALLPLLTPAFIHADLQASGSAAYLGVSEAQADALNDQTVHELIFGPGTFAITGPDGQPFYTAAEAAHLRDARSLLYLFLGVALVSAVLIGLYASASRRRPRALQGVRTGAVGLIVGVVVLGVVGAVAFEPAFELFHVIFFPGGNWAFDPATSHLVQLYPEPFWEVASAALGIGAVILASVTWLVVRRRGPV